MEEEALIGRQCEYRPLYERHTKKAVIVSTREVESYTGQVQLLVTLDNGDEVAATELYFARSSTA